MFNSIAYLCCDGVQVAATESTCRFFDRVFGAVVFGRMFAVVADALSAILQGESVARSLQKNIADFILRDRITNVNAHDHCLSATVAWGCGERSAE